MGLPSKYSWLSKEEAPKLLVEALKWYGTKEVPGKESNPVIMGWAKSLNISWYTADSVPFCGLGMGIWAKNAGYPFDKNKLLAAKSWLEWGIPVATGKEMLGDVLVFGRIGGGHVGLYIGEDQSTFHVYGANQSDDTGFTRILKTRLLGARRSPFKSGQPANIRKVLLSESGEISKNEA
ncbi:TIGR02594 family protein [Pedobacter cryoconitis]|uniref:Uncharacterized protein (TIGR02594 family) n=1 Tax=Pedobacter cryoconitis TaxID=188932 RepID=A0A327SIB3_9SPHI|nr:TIGR02594 family protein [Pedobacter cryoconitis]RAJ28860.1 uncharacterized protein (TIGR02594 family) [Pedobacter cryoconitis]